MSSPDTITRRPRRPGYEELGGPGTPGDEYVVCVGGVAIGETYWCGGGKDANWGSWGPAGSSQCHPTRAAAEEFQAAAFLAAMSEREWAPAPFLVEVALCGGPAFLVEVQALTWAHAKQVAAETWPHANGYLVRDEDDDLSDLIPATAKDVAAAIEARRAQAREWERQRRDAKARAELAQRRREERCGIRRRPDGAWFGTARNGDGDPRFDKTVLGAGAFAPNAAAVFGVLDRVTMWGWDEAVAFERILRTRAADRDMWFWSDVDDQVQCAAQASGSARSADLRGLEAGLKHLRLQNTPEPAARKPGEYSDESALWDGVMFTVGRVARAYLVADRGELSDEAYAAATGAWQEAFPGDPVPARPTAAAADLAQGVEGDA